MKTFRNDIIISVANDPQTAYFDPRYIRFGEVLSSPLIKIRDFCSWQASTSRAVHAYSIFNLFRQVRRQDQFILQFTLYSSQGLYSLTPFEVSFNI